MDLNVIGFGYLFLRLAPFVLASFFILASIFNQDFKGFIYLVGVVLIGLKFVLDSYRLMVSKSSSEAIALFKYSITYLAVLFALLLFDHFWYLSGS